MKNLLLILLFLTVIVNGCVIKTHPSGNRYICEYFSNCKGNVEDGFSCSQPEFDLPMDCEITHPQRLKDKIESLRYNIPDEDVIKAYYPNPVPKPEVEYINYPDNRDSVNNQIITIACSTGEGYKNVFLVKENSLVGCYYVGLVE